MKKRPLIIWSIIATGISSVCTQLLTIREILTQFHGNEITISLVLFVWLIFIGAGSLLARAVTRGSAGLYFTLLLLVAIWPLVQLLGIRWMRDVFFIHGTSAGFYHILFFLFLVTSPYCLITGFVLPYSQKVMNSSGFHFETGQLYLMDNIGDIIGGVGFSFILVYTLSPFQTVAVSSLLLIIISLLFLGHTRLTWLIILAVPCAGFFILCLDSSFERKSLEPQYGKIEKYLESPYGRIVVTEEGNQNTVWESGMPLYSSFEIVQAEEKVHYPLSQLSRKSNIRVLLVSGGLGQTLKEIQKYRPAHIDYVELDPALTQVALEVGIIDYEENLKIINADGREFIKDTRNKYEAIIIDMPDPDTFQINRFYTDQFFKLAKSRLVENGVLSISIQYSPNYISQVRKEKISILYKTLRRHFSNILILPGGELYFLCSDRPMSARIPERLNSLGIHTKYLEGFFYGNITHGRIKYLEGCIDLQAPINSDFKPALIHVMLKEWYEKQGKSPVLFFCVLVVLSLCYLVFIRKEEMVLFSTGLVSMGTEMIVIYTIQIIYGYVYLKIGAIVTAFLLGLLPGAALGNRIRAKDRIVLLLCELCLIFLLGLFLLWISFLRTDIFSFCYLGYGLVFSTICGFQFPVAARLIGEEVSPAAGCFAADIAGAAVGAFFLGSILIPLWGMVASLGFLISIKGLGIIIYMCGGMAGNSNQSQNNLFV